MPEPSSPTRPHNSFAFWRATAANDPEFAADELLRRANAQSRRSSAIAGLRSREQIAQQFASALSPSLSQDGGQTRRLAAVPYLLKDLFDVRGELTGCSSLLLPQIGTPARSDSLVQRAAVSAGAVYVGRTHMNEFAYGFDGKNAHFGNCPNPHDPQRIAGGSSSGSAWAVAKGVVPLAFGTDTGGSVRVPAAFCGLFGFRRSVDQWAGEGVFPLARSFDTAGWFTAQADDMAEALRALWEEDPAGERTAERPREKPETADRHHAVDRPGVLYLPGLMPLEAEVADQAERLAERLGTVRDRELQREIDALLPDGTRAYDVIASSEAYETHRDWLDRHRDLYDPVVWARIDRARRWNPDDVEKARRLKQRMEQLIQQVLARYEYLAMPATPLSAPLLSTPDAEYRTSTLMLAVPASLAGAPVLTVPLSHTPGYQSDRPACLGGLQILVSSERLSQPRAILERLRG